MTALHAELETLKKELEEIERPTCLPFDTDIDVKMLRYYRDFARKQALIISVMGLIIKELESKQ